ncbi:MAG: Gldg family protein [Deltaproteobacteria bacterium]|nr:Gldg family protein [Deltaproteobacteria bacterium]
MNDTQKTIVALVLVAIIAFCAITITDSIGRFWRIDLTDNNLYTLSEGTKTVIGEVNQPIDLKLYYARTAALKGPEALRAYNNYYLYIRDLLREYEKISRGKIRLSVIDPRPDTDEELDAVQYGLKRFSAGEESFFFGLAVISQFGQEATIPFFIPERQGLVEYEISSAIYNAATQTKRKVGILSPLRVFGTGSSPYMIQMLKMQGKQPEEEWLFIKELKRQYELLPIGVDAREIEPLDLLIVIHPKDLPQNLLFAIDQYVMKGGKLMVFADPYCIKDPSKLFYEKASNLNFLLEKWGCSMPSGYFAADRSLGLTIQQGADQPAKRLVTFLDLKGDAFNRSDVITARLESVRVLFAGVLKPTGVPGVTVEPLLMTSSSGNALKYSKKDVAMYSDPETIENRFKEGNKPAVMGYKLTGKFKSAFPDGVIMKDDKDKQPKKYEGLKESDKQTSVVVYSDIDILSDFVAFQESFFGVAASGDNLNILLNSMENLVGSRALATARTKEMFSRPFTVLNDIEAEAEKETAKKVALVKKDIAERQKELQNIGSQVNDDNASLLQSEAIKKKRDLEEQLMLAKRELRELNKDKRIKIEALIGKLKMYNIVTAPSVILLIAVVVFLMRTYRKKKYLGVRHEK